MNAADVETALDLVELLIGANVQSARAAERIEASDRWPTALSLAAHWHVIPTLTERLRDSRPAAFHFGRAIEANLRAQAAIAAVRSSTALDDAATVLGELDEAGIPAVAIKGIAAIATLYGSAAQRMVSDVDIVIRPSDLAAARAALARRGYVDRSPPFERHVFDITWSRALHNFARTYVRNGFEIDLHWQFGPRPPAALAADRVVDRAVVVPIAQYALRVAGPIETGLLIVHHVLRNSFHPASTIKDLIDLAEWWKRHGAAMGDQLAQAACESGLGSSLLALLLALAQRKLTPDRVSAIAFVDAKLDGTARRHAWRLHAFFERALRDERPDSATVALFAPAVYLRSLALPAWKALAEQGPSPLPADVAAIRKPLTTRVLRRLARGWRIARELADVGRIGSYRAVARAQSRFH